MCFSNLSLIRLIYKYADYYLVVPTPKPNVKSETKHVHQNGSSDLSYLVLKSSIFGKKLLKILILACLKLKIYLT